MKNKKIRRFIAMVDIAITWPLRMLVCIGAVIFFLGYAVWGKLRYGDSFTASVKQFATGFVDGVKKGIRINALLIKGEECDFYERMELYKELKGL